MINKLLEVDDLKIQARSDDGEITPIIKGVSFTVNKGEVVALIGESGSGKTTLSLAALAYCRPGLEFASGQVRLDGKDILSQDNETIRSLRGRRVAYLAQSAIATFNPALTIGEQVTEPAVLHGLLTQDQAEEYALELYKELDLPNPEALGRKYPHQVSGGQLQRLMAAMALITKPDLLVLDEPTTALDVTTQIEVLQAFKNVIRKENSAAIYVTHDLAVVAQVADHIVVLYQGEIVETGTVDQIINSTKHPYTKRLLAAISPNHISTDTLNDELLHQASSINVKDLTAGYGGIEDGMPRIPILYDINFQLKKSEIVGVIGESGSGKSTLAKVIAGILPAAKGTVSLDDNGLEASLSDRSKEDLHKIQFVFQMADTALNPRHFIGDILGRPLEFYHGLKGDKKHERISELLQTVELPAEIANRYPSELSGGQKQRVNLARALAADPEVLLCDEVTSALDTIVGENIIKLLKNLRDKFGVSIMFISHDISSVATLADRIMVLYAGRVVEEGTVDEVLSPPYHPYTELLISTVPELRIGWLEEAMSSQATIAGIGASQESTSVGCAFYSRCPKAIPDKCANEVPNSKSLTTYHKIHCHLDQVQF